MSRVRVLDKAKARKYSHASEESEMAFFRDHSPEAFLGCVEASTNLYQCQKGALFAVAAHFTAGHRPAIVSMPTGSGKTEVMIGACFVLRPVRVLIVEPAIVLRNQTADRFRRMGVFRDARLIDSIVPEPSVLSLETVCSTQEAWESLKDYDVVVASPKTVSPEQPGVCMPQSGSEFFDLLLFDEAHHAAARTWRSIIECFPAARTIMFTATPFRRDRRRLPGQLIYHYPMGKALDDGIYREVTFRPVAYRSTTLQSDEALASAASEALQSERALGNHARVLARVDRIEKANSLVAVYERAGLRTRAVHNRLTKDNARNLAALRNGQLDCVICVGMLSEGLDIPSMKIAVLHSPPNSLPYTLQFIGRVSRNPSDQTGPAYLLAIPDTVRGEARKLYREDRDWRRFVPQLVDDAIDAAHQDRVHAFSSQPSGIELLAEDLKPFFAVRFFKSHEGLEEIDVDVLLADLESIKGMPRTVEQCWPLVDYRPGCVALVTETVDTPAWAKQTSLFDTRYDLHVFYRPPSRDILVVASTSDLIAEPLRNVLAPGSKPVEPGWMSGVLTAVEPDGYLTVGLVNATGYTGAHPSYRVHLGRGSGSSVRASDGRVYGAGHAMARVGLNEIRGVAFKNRKARGMRREAFGAFLDWCDELINHVSLGNAVLPGLSFLAEATIVESLSEEPIAVLLDDLLASSPRSIRLRAGVRELRGDIDPHISTIHLVNDVLECELSWNSQEPPLPLTFVPSRADPWQCSGNGVGSVVLEVSDTQLIHLCIGDYLNRFSPTLIMPSGG